MKCCHTIDGSLPPCLGDSGGSDAPSPIGVAGSGGLGLALPGLGGGRLGLQVHQIQVEHRHLSNKKISKQQKNKVPTTISNYNFSSKCSVK